MQTFCIQRLGLSNRTVDIWQLAYVQALCAYVYTYQSKNGYSERVCSLRLLSFLQQSKIQRLYSQILITSLPMAVP